MMDTGRPVLAIVGATASGKNIIAQEIAAVSGASLVSVDSRKIYRGMDIGTAKPSATIQEKYNFGMIDCVNPDQTFSAAEYALRARAIVTERVARGEPVILVGGTGFYLDAFINGLADLPSITPETRRDVLEKAGQDGWESIYLELREQDPIGAAQIAPTDKTRLLRAAEVLRQTGRPLREWLTDSVAEKFPKRVLVYEAGHPREELHRRIAERTKNMIHDGLVEETEQLMRNGYGHGSPGMATVGYVETMEYLENKISRDLMVEKIINHTRQYAKRQLTWFRHRDYAQQITIEDDVVQRLIGIWRRG